MINMLQKLFVENTDIFRRALCGLELKFKICKCFGRDDGYLRLLPDNIGTRCPRQCKGFVGLYLIFSGIWY